MKNSKILKLSVLTTASMFVIPMLSHNNAGAWPWSSKKPAEKIEQTVPSESIEVIEAHKAYVESEDATQQALAKYQEASINYKKANLDSTQAYEKLQKCTAVWAEALAAKDAAYDRWCIDAGVKDAAYQEWVSASQVERDTRLNKENAYIEWIKLSSLEKQTYKSREEAYEAYKSALLNQKNAHIFWSRVCAEDAVVVNESQCC